MQKEPRIQSRDNKTFGGYIAYPETDHASPGIIVIQEIFGVNANIKNICENLAQAGYIAFAPDLFWRIQPGIELDDKVEADMQQAFKHYSAFDVNLGVEDLTEALAYLRKDKKCTGAVGTIGYCLGGKLAYLMGTRSDSDCNVSYYGVGIQDYLVEAENIKQPMYLHIAENDKFVPLEAQKKIMTSLDGIDDVEVDVYPGVDHAFARQGGANYDKEAAHQANYRTADFLATFLTPEKEV